MALRQQFVQQQQQHRCQTWLFEWMLLHWSSVMFPSYRAQLKEYNSNKNNNNNGNSCDTIATKLFGRSPRTETVCTRFHDDQGYIHINWNITNQSQPKPNVIFHLIGWSFATGHAHTHQYMNSHKHIHTNTKYKHTFIVRERKWSLHYIYD